MFKGKVVSGQAYVFMKGLSCKGTPLVNDATAHGHAAERRGVRDGDWASGRSAGADQLD